MWVGSGFYNGNIFFILVFLELGLFWYRERVIEKIMDWIIISNSINNDYYYYYYERIKDVFNSINEF